MPALWQSSQRPMYIRTVWVDGFRHAILSHDDPYLLELTSKRRRPHSSASCSKPKPTRKTRSRLSNHNDDLEDCLRKLHLVIRSDKKTREIETIPSIEKLDLSDVDQSDDEIIVKASPQPIYEFDSCRNKFDSLTNMRAVKSNRTARTDLKENTELSDRVLQWLDLAGKIDLLAPDSVERMSLPRHSWPEIQRRNLTKCKTATDLRAKDSRPVDQKVHTSAVIDRHEFYVPTSANTIENYARQSRNIKTTPRNDMKKEIRKVRDTRANVIETRQKMVSERNAVEKQYAELVSKKLIPDVCRTKKQVHIFMPEALTKRVGSNVTSRTESLLSQKS